MKPGAARIGTKVRFTHDTNQASKDTIGTIVELRGWDFDLGKKIQRWVGVWVERQTLPSGGYAAMKNVQCGTGCLERVD